jgi:calcium-dependent protein kinase
MWSVGVILFVLLCGYPPFADENQSALFQSIRMGDWSFDEQDWAEISDDAKEVIRNLLVVDPLRRWTAREALDSKWMSEKDAVLSVVDLSKAMEKLKIQRQKSIKDIARTVMLMNKVTSSMKANMESDVKPGIPKRAPTAQDSVISQPESDGEIEEQKKKMEEILCRPDQEEEVDDADQNSPKETKEKDDATRVTI